MVLPLLIIAHRGLLLVCQMNSDKLLHCGVCIQMQISCKHLTLLLKTPASLSTMFKALGHHQSPLGQCIVCVL